MRYILTYGKRRTKYLFEFPVSFTTTSYKIQVILFKLFWSLKKLETLDLLNRGSVYITLLMGKHYARESKKVLCILIFTKISLDSSV